MTVATAAASRIRGLRERHGWSQSELTRRVVQLGGQIDRSAIVRIELGQRKLGLDEAIQFAIALDVSLLELLFGTDGDASIQLANEKSILSVKVTAADACRWAIGDVPLPFLVRLD